MSLEHSLSQLSSVVINQKRELVELVGFETRNKYAIEDADGKQIGFAAEQQKGLLGILLRQLLGHWRSFEIHIFDQERQLRFKAVHPFRFYFERLELHDFSGRVVGALEKRFAIFSKKFEVEDEHGRVVMTVNSPIWRIWTFPFKRDGGTVAVVTKKWKGIIQESFLDSDRFLITYDSPALSVNERALILASGIFVDLMYFENNQGNAGGGLVGNILDVVSPG